MRGFRWGATVRLKDTLISYGIHKMALDFATERNLQVFHATTWMNMLCEIRQMHKRTSALGVHWYKRVHWYKAPGVVKSIETGNRMVVAWVWGEGKEELLFNGDRVSVLQDEKCARDKWWWWSHSTVKVLNATLSCTFRNGLNSRFYVIFILPQ